MTYTQARQIRVNQGEYLPLELQVSANLRDSNGSLLIPAGTRIIGQLQPTQQGTRLMFIVSPFFRCDPRSRLLSQSNILSPPTSWNFPCSLCLLNMIIYKPL